MTPSKQPRSRSRQGSASPLDYQQAVGEVSEAVAALSSSLRTVLLAALPSGSGPRSCGRALGLSVTTGWRCWTIAHSNDPALVLRWLPGRIGWGRILRGFSKRGCGDADLQALQAAIERLRATIDSHHIRPSMLRSIAAGGLDSERLREGMLKARRDASRADATIYGVHAKAIVGGFLIGPPDSKRRIGLATFLLMDALARPRPGPPWPIFQRTCSFREGRSRRMLAGAGEPRHRLPPLLDDLSTPGLAEGAIRVGEYPDAPTLDFDEPPAGLDSVRAAFLEFTPHAGTMGRDERSLNLRCPIKFPADRAIYDVLLHRSLGIEAPPAAAMYGAPPRWGRDPGWGTTMRLPLETTTVVVAGPGLPRALRAADSTYRRLLERAAARAGAVLDEFILHRLVVPYPPIHATLVMRWD